MKNLGFALLLILSACSHPVALYCDVDTPCEDPARPYCDLYGTYEESEHIGRTCIPFPWDAGVEPMAPDATPERRVVDLAIGTNRTCAILSDGGLRCWGGGPLGYASLEPIGDDESPASAGDVPTGGSVSQVAMGTNFTCILLTSGDVRCFGDGGGGQLGYGNTEDLGGPGQTPDQLPNVPLGEAALSIVAGSDHICALLASGNVRCWGEDNFGSLGYPDDEERIGDDETPASRPPVEIGGAAIALAAGFHQTCALLAGPEGRLRCWGQNSFGAALGYGHTEDVGGLTSPASAGDLPLGGIVRSVQSNGSSFCALLATGAVRCWGATSAYGPLALFGDTEPASAGGDLALVGGVDQLGAGVHCALREGGTGVCFDDNAFGQLGYGHTDPVPAAEAASLNIGGSVSRLPTMSGGRAQHSCAVLDTGAVRCWGKNDAGQLGYGHTEDIGDDESPAISGDVALLP